MENHRSSTPYYRRLARERITAEQLEQEAIARNARRQDRSSTLLDITNLDITTNTYTTSNHASRCTRGLLPTTSEARLRFLQLYIYDTDHEIENRLAENNTLRQDIVEKVKAILDRCKPFVHNLQSLAQQGNIQDCALRIDEQPSDRPQYCLPTASQVAAIIVCTEEVANLNPRYILVQSTSGQLMNVSDTAGYYDPL
uniref:Uncharacterized protein n=1 Tax=Chenopodium quinoa TaxID=63459 RepID=A0A803N4S5_CHEQI